jgi:RNA polymerase sigma-B factor
MRNAPNYLELLPAAGTGPSTPQATSPTRWEDLDDTALFERLPTADEREQELIKQILVERHTGLVRWLANRYANPAVDVEELVCVGNLGLVLAMTRYQPDRGCDFVSFARPTVQGEIRRYFRDKRRFIQMPRRLQESRAALRKAEESLTHHLGRLPQAADYAEHLDMDEAEVLEALGADDCFSPASLESPIGSDDGYSLAETFGEVDERFELLLDCAALRPLLDGLEERDRQIVHMRFFEELTQAQIGDRIGCSQMHVSRLLNRVLDRLRRGLDDSSRPGALADAA